MASLAARTGGLLSVLWRLTRNAAGRLRREPGPVVAAAIPVVAGLVVILTFALTLLGIGPFVQQKPVSAPDLSLEAKFREVGDSVWTDNGWLTSGNRIEYGVFIRNNGDGAATDLLARIALPANVHVEAGSCRFRWEGRKASCVGEIAGGGLLFPTLEGGANLDIVLIGEVDPGRPGGRLPATAVLNSNETPETTEAVDVYLEESPAERAVREIYRGQAEDDREFWAGQPLFASRSKRLLIERWRRLDPDRAHSFTAVPGGPLVSLARLWHDRRLDGRVVELDAYVSTHPSSYRRKGRPGLVVQSFAVGVGDSDYRGWCFATRRRRRLLRFGDRVWVRAVPIAWGSSHRNDGGYRSMTLLVCPAIRRLSG